MSFFDEYPNSINIFLLWDLFALRGGGALEKDRRTRMLFFDNAAGSYPKPQEVKNAVMESFDKYGANPGRGAYKLSLNTSRMVYETRLKTAAFFNCPDPQRFIFTAGATESANMALKGWLKPGDHVIYSGLEHNALWRPLMQMEEEGRITTTRIKPNQYAYVIAADFEKAITTQTRLIVCVHAGNVSGERAAD